MACLPLIYLEKTRKVGNGECPPIRQRWYYFLWEINVVSIKHSFTSPRVLQFHENKTEIPRDKEKSFHIYIFSIALKERLQ